MKREFLERLNQVPENKSKIINILQNTGVGFFIHQATKKFKLWIKSKFDCQKKLNLCFHKRSELLSEPLHRQNTSYHYTSVTCNLKLHNNNYTGPDGINIRNLKHLGSLAIRYLTNMYRVRTKSLDKF